MQDNSLASEIKRELDKRTIFVLLQWYLPGFKAGGAIRSIANLVEALGQEFKFKIVTSDRDLDEQTPYPGLVTNQWVRVGNAEIMYLSAGWKGTCKLISQLRSLNQNHVLYLNSVFSRRFSMLPALLLRMGLTHPASVVLAPRGEFSSGALKIKKTRKFAYLMASKWLGLFRRMILHASTQFEAADILRTLSNSQELCEPTGTKSIAIRNVRGTHSRVVVAEDIASLSVVNDKRKNSKRPGHLRAVFISRISRKKNLIGALKMLRYLKGDVIFNVYGPQEDKRYWNECKRVISELPKNIHAEYCGTVHNEKVNDVFSQHDLFLFPTFGENYGHVIAEALGSGCPVLISDQTPWRNLVESGAGWDFPLSDAKQFQDVLQECVNADCEWMAEKSSQARRYAETLKSGSDSVEANRRLFQLVDKEYFGKVIQQSRPRETPA